VKDLGTFYLFMSQRLSLALKQLPVLFEMLELCYSVLLDFKSLLEIYSTGHRLDVPYGHGQRKRYCLVRKHLKGC
jgi:hypothetical protein